jgi:CheY-like chemotaxis protein
MNDILKKKILLVDDDSFLLNMYSLKFEKSNYEVVSALSSQEAINKLKDGFKPDILIFDVIMPGMDGIDLLSAVRNQHLADQAKCMMLTNQGESVDIDKAKKIGIDGYIVKATSIPSEVVKAVENILAKK